MSYIYHTAEKKADSYKISSHLRPCPNIGNVKSVSIVPVKKESYSGYGDYLNTLSY